MDESKSKFYLKLIVNCIQEFNTNKIDLAKLVSDLETTIESLHDISYKHASQLWESWCILEMIYASELSRKGEDKNYSFLTDSEVADILFAEIEKIRQFCI